MKPEICEKLLYKKRTIQAQVVDHARILLYKADGMTFQQIADKLAISTATVRLCVSKFQKGGLDAALFDVQRPGHPLEITDDAKAWMIHIACQRPTALGYAQELWMLTSLHKYIQKHAEEAGYPRLLTVTKPYIQKFLRFLYKGIIINQNKKLSQPTLKRRFFKKKAAFFSWPGLGKEWC